MISTSDREHAMTLIDEACAAGARQALACQQLGVSARTLQRWRTSRVDARTLVRHEEPANKLSRDEREAVLAVCNRADCASLTPHQIVPKLADEGVYLASESTFYRVLRLAGQNCHRGRSKARVSKPLTTHRATGRNQVWCWDITWLPSPVKGRYYYWYMMQDIYSRKLVANEVYEVESSHNASELLRKACLREQTAHRPLVLHSDNGAPMRSTDFTACMQSLGVVPSYSRPRVSNDNAYAEALFRTAKYCPLWPQRPFASLSEARQWVLTFVRWYNEEHKHSALKYTTPEQRHKGEAPEVLRRRDAVYAKAQQAAPERWSRTTRNWDLPSAVYLNPEREQHQQLRMAA